MAGLQILFALNWWTWSTHCLGSKNHKDFWFLFSWDGGGLAGELPVWWEISLTSLCIMDSYIYGAFIQMAVLEEMKSFDFNCFLTLKYLQTHWCTVYTPSLHPQTPAQSMHVCAHTHMHTHAHTRGYLCAFTEAWLWPCRLSKARMHFGWSLSSQGSGEFMAGTSPRQSGQFFPRQIKGTKLCTSWRLSNICFRLYPHTPQPCSRTLSLPEIRYVRLMMPELSRDWGNTSQLPERALHTLVSISFIC